MDEHKKFIEDALQTVLDRGVSEEDVARILKEVIPERLGIPLDEFLEL